jgi:cytochrome c biogenesis protein CcmG, thiol:disulfide interchange protein DsbE
MASFLPIVTSLLLSAVLIQGAELKFPSLKVGSVTYSNVVVTSLTTTDVYFTHSRGLGNAKLATLDPELQTLFRFDPAKAKAKRDQQLEANARYTKAAQEAKPPPPRIEEPSDPAAGEPSSGPISARSFLNQPAPRINVEKWLSDPPDLTGKFVIVDFWATWCGPCRRSIPHLNDLYNQYKDRLIVMGISDEPEAIVRKMTQPKIDYYVGIDSQRRGLTTVEVRGIPHALLVDPKGVVRFEGHPDHLDAKKLEALFARYSD